MKFGIDIGHNCPPYDTGAVGIQKEDNLTKAVGMGVMEKLTRAGHSVVDCTPKSASNLNSSLLQRTSKANQAQVDVFVSIHFNAFNGKASGSEVYAISNSGRVIAASVQAELVKLGYRNRGVKNRQFFVLKNTAMPAILIECCFCDSPEDMAKFDVEKMATAITTGLIGETNQSSEEYTLEITQPTLLKPSTEQSASLAPETCIEISEGKYPILDFSFEENHYWVKWQDQSMGDRQEHFIFAGHSKVA